MGNSLTSLRMPTLTKPTSVTLKAPSSTDSSWKHSTRSTRTATVNCNSQSTRLLGDSSASLAATETSATRSTLLTLTDQDLLIEMNSFCPSWDLRPTTSDQLLILIAWTASS